MADKKPKKGGALRLVLIVLLLLVVGVVGYGFTLSATPSFTANKVIKADADDIHEKVGDLKEWQNWGPWKDMDPGMTWSFTDKTNEVGSKMTFTGKDGTGWVELTKVDENGIGYKFQFESFTPMTGSITYAKVPEGTSVTWSTTSEDIGMKLHERYFMKFGADSMQEMFDKGLAKLKTQMEAN
jgi:hypothetical protein